MKLIFPWCFGTCSRVVGHPCGTTSPTKMCSQTWASRACHEPTKPSWLIGDPPKRIPRTVIPVQMNLLCASRHRSCMHALVHIFWTDTQFVSFWSLSYHDTVDVRNPANQLRLVVYPIIYRFLYIPGGERRISEPSNSRNINLKCLEVHWCVKSTPPSGVEEGENCGVFKQLEGFVVEINEISKEWWFIYIYILYCIYIHIKDWKYDSACQKGQTVWWLKLVSVILNVICDVECYDIKC